ncbi:MAG: DUF1330 domain-containing protein [Myxococcales bacterium]|nr:DUF1330 domain-containing protein [Myxococcales bacterium]
MLEPLVRHVVVMGLQVTDPLRFSLYCARMRPILTSHGGRVEYDLVVSEVIESSADADVNRVHALSFPDPAARRAFDADPEHQRLHAELFEPAVASTMVLGVYDAPG